MNYQSELHSIMQGIIESPKTTGIVATATTSLGLASVTDLISGALSFAAVLAGFIATLLLGKVHWVKYQNERITNRMLRRQAQELGIDLTVDE